MDAHMSSPTAAAGQNTLTSSASTTTSSESILGQRDLVSSTADTANKHTSTDLTSASTNLAPLIFTGSIASPSSQPQSHETAVPITSSNATETSTRLETFTCFSRLPVELRLKIWEEVDANEPRILIIQNEGIFLLNCWKNPKAMYFVNKEARFESLRLNPFLCFRADFVSYIGVLESAKARFNPNIDTLLFDGCNCDTYDDGFNTLHWLQKEKLNDKCLEKIRHIGFANYYGDSRLDIYDYKALPNLIGITLYLLDYNEVQVADEETKFRTISDEEENTYSAANPDGEDWKLLFETHKKDVVEGLKMGIWNRGVPPKVHRAIIVGGEIDCLLTAMANKEGRAGDGGRDGDDEDVNEDEDGDEGGTGNGNGNRDGGGGDDGDGEGEGDENGGGGDGDGEGEGEGNGA